MKCLGYIKRLTTSLQIDICHAYNTTLQEVHESVDIHHKQWFDIASELAEKVNGCPPDYQEDVSIREQGITPQLIHLNCTTNG